MQSQRLPDKRVSYFDGLHGVHHSRLPGVLVDQQVHVVVCERREELDLHVGLFHHRRLPHGAVQQGSRLGSDVHGGFEIRERWGGDETKSRSEQEHNTGASTD